MRGGYPPCRSLTHHGLAAPASRSTHRVPTAPMSHMCPVWPGWVAVDLLEGAGRSLEPYGLPFPLQLSWPRFGPAET